MGRQTIERSASTAAAPPVVYALLRDGSTRPAWAPVERGTGPLLRPALLRFDRDTVEGLARHAPRA